MTRIPSGWWLSKVSWCVRWLRRHKCDDSATPANMSRWLTLQAVKCEGPCRRGRWLRWHMYDDSAAWSTLSMACPPRRQSESDARGIMTQALCLCVWWLRCHIEWCVGTRARCLMNHTPRSVMFQGISSHKPPKGGLWLATSGYPQWLNP